MQKLIIRPRLRYPVSPIPRFDPSHPCAIGMEKGNNSWSIITTPNSIVDLMSGTACTFPNNPGTFNISGNIGPFWLSDVGGYSSMLTPTGSTSEPSSITMASIVQLPVIASPGELIGLNGVLTFGVRGGAGGALALFGSATTTFSITISANIPYLLVISCNPGINYNLVVVNLLTGSVKTSSGSMSTTYSGTYTGNGYCGQDGLGATYATVAAAMWSPTFLSMQTILKWAQDPWSFWYDDRQSRIISLSLRGLTGSANVNLRFTDLQITT